MTTTGGLAGGNTGPRGNLALRGCPYSRVDSTNPKDLGPEDPYPKGNLRKEGKREDGSLDFLLRLVAPGGPADIWRLHVAHVFDDYHPIAAPPGEIFDKLCSKK